MNLNTQDKNALVSLSLTDEPIAVDVVRHSNRDKVLFYNLLSDCVHYQNGWITCTLITQWCFKLPVLFNLLCSQFTLLWFQRMVSFTFLNIHWMGKTVTEILLYSCMLLKTAQNIWLRASFVTWNYSQSTLPAGKYEMISSRKNKKMVTFFKLQSISILAIHSQRWMILVSVHY